MTTNERSRGPPPIGLPCMIRLTVAPFCKAMVTLATASGLMMPALALRILSHSWQRLHSYPYLKYTRPRSSEWPYLQSLIYNFADFSASAAFALALASRTASAPHSGYSWQCLRNFVSDAIAGPNFPPLVMRLSVRPARSAVMNSLA